MLDGGHHEVAHVLARDAAGACHDAHGLPVAAVEGEGDAHALAVVAADLQAVRAPAGVARVDGNAPSCRRSSPPAWRWSRSPCTFMTR